MKVIYDLDPKIKGKIEEQIALPQYVLVNDFSEESAKTFYKDFQAAHATQQSVIPIVIDSYGGAVNSLVAMVDVLRQSEKPIATIALGKAMSCGAVLLSYGTPGYRYAAENSTVMIHDVSGWSFGKVEDNKAHVKYQDSLNEWIYRSFDTNCNKKKGYFLDEIHKRHNADWYLTAQDALKHGVVDHIGIPYFKVKTRVSIDFVGAE